MRRHVRIIALTSADLDDMDMGHRGFEAASITAAWEAMDRWVCTTDWTFESEVWHSVRTPNELETLAQELDAEEEGAWAKVCELIREVWE